MNINTNVIKLIFTTLNFYKKQKFKKYKSSIKSHFLFKCAFIIIINLIIFQLFFLCKINKKIGIISVRHNVNIGNNLLKYAISIKLKELGYIPYIIGTRKKKHNSNITFINQTTNLVIIQNSFKEIKKDDYDVLMVNSDQTWRRWDKYFYDYGFLKFAEKWNIKKFVYGASIGFNTWKLSKRDDKIARNLLKNFTGISVREEGSIKLIRQHFKVNPTLVLDPTLLIDKKYYLDIIKDYHGKIEMKNKYIFMYTTYKNNIVTNLSKKAGKIFNYDVYYYQLNNNSLIQDFIYYMVNSNAVITSSFHGSVFSIIFNKPFITIYNKLDAKERFNSLDKIFGIHDRLFEKDDKVTFEQLLKPLNIDYKLLNQLKKNSINFLIKNLEK